MPSHSFVRRVLSATNAAVSLQIGLSLFSVGRGANLAGVEEESPLLEQREVFDSGHYRLVANYVSSLYSRNSYLHADMIGVKMANTATWEDPKCVFQGPQEIRQAFRLATQDLDEPPRCVDVEPQGESIAITYALSYPNYGQQSLLVVTVEMHQMKDSPEFNEFVITKMEEQWNGIPLFQSMLFWIVRRVNGFAAFQLSSGLGW